ncbi:hypothetical protein P799_10770 [Lysinibacillus sphaericus CBAM5]|uniref:Uncharacterized protein n=1 Tax=Lysinibacillus sphaericus CBAM5 TaxID=1400869 RepID=W7S1E2_LYSSH|nr:hypothetical protein P799_10770 [Lysinibacillus sphaericus CBAM5]
MVLQFVVNLNSEAYSHNVLEGDERKFRRSEMWEKEKLMLIKTSNFFISTIHNN